MEINIENKWVRYPMITFCLGALAVIIITSPREARYAVFGLLFIALVVYLLIKFIVVKEEDEDDL